MSGMNFGDFASACVERTQVNGNQMKIAGVFHVEQVRKGKIIEAFDMPNGIVNEGLNKALGNIFNNIAIINPWFLGLINQAPAPGFDATDTLASNDFTEFTGYSEADRVDWGEDAASGQSITNSTAATFTINVGSATLNGIFVTSELAKGDFVGTLWSTASFASQLAVVDTDVIKITYTVSAI